MLCISVHSKARVLHRTRKARTARYRLDFFTSFRLLPLLLLRLRDRDLPYTHSPSKLLKGAPW